LAGRCRLGCRVHGVCGVGAGRGVSKELVQEFGAVSGVLLPLRIHAGEIGHHH
jgi:hypothetical protein